MKNFKKLIKNSVAADCKLEIFNRISNTIIACAIFSFFAIILQGLAFKIDSYLIGFVMESIVNSIAATLSYSIYKLWLTPWFAIYYDWKYFQNIKNNIPTLKDEDDTSIDRLGLISVKDIKLNSVESNKTISSNIKKVSVR